MLNLDHLAVLHEHLTALTRPYALAVLTTLAEQPLTVEQLAQHLDISGSTLNQTLMALRKARMIKLQKQEAYFVYIISNPQVKQLLVQIEKIYA